MDISDHSEDEINEKKGVSQIDEKEVAVVDSVRYYSHLDRDVVIEHLSHSRDLKDIIEDEIQLNFILEKLALLGSNEALVILGKAEKYHQDDYNFPQDTMTKIQRILKGPMDLDEESYEVELRIEATLMKYYSPYPEVRSVVSPVDDPTAYVETIRAYAVGLLWSAVGSYICELFQPHQPSLTISAVCLQILAFPCGKFLARVLPDKGVTLFGKRHSLNPGPWSYKEQMFVTIMINTGGRFSNVINHIFILKLPVYFDQKWVKFGFMFLMNMSTEFFGFGMAGVLRRWVVYSPKAVWPTIMPTLALNKTLMLPEQKQSINGWTISRYRLLAIGLAGSFCYYFLPDFLFQALSIFNWMTWIAPENKTLAIVTGSKLGMGFNPLATFDWATINYSTPLAKPFFSTLNQYIGAVGSGLLILALYWKNYKYTGHLPINSSSTFANDGTTFTVSKVLTSDNRLDEAKYKAYSPPYLTAGNLVRQGAAFAQYTTSFVFILLTDWRLLVQTFKSIGKSIKNLRNGANDIDDFDDPISRMMSVYPEVPGWWYLSILVVALAFGIIAFETYPVGVGVWVIFTIFGISCVLLLPSAIIYAVSGYQLVLNDFMALVGGYLVPGSGIGVLMCRFYGWNMDVQSETFVSDLKIGHYSKLPPRAVFRGQIVSTLLHVFVTLGSILTLLDTIPNICTSTQTNRFTCPTEGGMFTSVIMFGTIGPDRVLNNMYPGLKYCFLVGVLLAIITYVLRRAYPEQMRYVHPVILMSGFAVWGQTYNLTYYTGGLIASYFFMSFIKRRYIAWWTKYNYVLTSALTAGTAFSAIVIFGGLSYTQTTVDWWGNSVSAAGIDGTQSALYAIPEKGYFGVGPGEFE
ncbi:OPT oligopeptide transporter protein-domain-containing protein [Limtongia smithiae]|uniref:OPT oligopeptide transporter protein-domain-containing protein n=1 Tax=Limtongia smithiae TaxID=1125753 RepID=UPI0034CE8E79